MKLLPIHPFLLCLCPLLISAGLTVKEKETYSADDLSQEKLHTIQGRDIIVHSIKSKKADTQPIPILIQGGMHGNEHLTTQFVVWLMERYESGQSIFNRLPLGERLQFDFIPRLNPDGLSSSSRYNARGVNLNRNFPILWGMADENPGKSPFSEPETRFLKQLFQKRNYFAAIDIHGYINWVVGPSASPAIKNKPSQAALAKYFQWTQILEKHLRLLPSYQLKTAAHLGDGGAFEDWAFWEHGTYAFCLELERIQVTEISHAFLRYENFLAKTLESALTVTFQEVEASESRGIANANPSQRSKPKETPAALH